MAAYPDLNYKELYDSSPCGYFCSIPSGEIIESNQRFLSFTGYTQEEVIGKKKLVDFLTAGGRIFLETHFLPILRFQGVIEEVNFDFVKKDGTKLPVLINSIVIKNKAGNHILTQFTVFNISQRKSYEKELLIAKRKADDLSSQLMTSNKSLKRSSKLILEQKSELEKLNGDLHSKNKQLSDFAHIASHNLRSPVNNLNALLDFYKESTDAEDKASLMDMINKLTVQMTETLNELVDSLKIQENLGITKDFVFFNKALDKTKIILSSQIKESKAVVTTDFSKCTKVEYSKVYLESIVLNMLSNAIRYRSPDRIPKIHFQTVKKTEEIILKITDNGLGMDLKKHGDKLFVLNKTFHNHPDSKGVGLFMTKTQVEEMGGSITAESEVDKGTTFEIVLIKNV